MSSCPPFLYASKQSVFLPGTLHTVWIRETFRLNTFGFSTSETQLDGKSTVIPSLYHRDNKPRTMNTIREIQAINDRELELGIAGTPASWHTQYAHSAWIYIGNLSHSLTEGDIVCVLSQYGEIEDMYLCRDDTTGESRGFGFAKYEDARSCVLAVDNLIGATVAGRSLRVEHVERYRLPKHLAEQEEGKDRTRPGQAYAGQELENGYSLEQGQDLFAVSAPPARNNKQEKEKQSKRERKEDRRRKREEKEKKRRAKRRRREDRAREDGRHVVEPTSSDEEDRERSRMRRRQHKDKRRRSSR